MMADAIETPDEFPNAYAIKHWTAKTWAAVVFGLTLFGSLCSIASLWFAGPAKPKLTYWVDSTRTQIFRADEDGGLQVTHNGKLVESDVSSMQVAVWNAGSGSSKSDQVLRKITAKLEPSATILSCKTISQSRSEIDCRISSDFKNYPDTVFPEWKILEEGDGFVFQIIYEGGEDIDCTLTGSVEGQQEMVRVGTFLKNGGETLVLFLLLLLTLLISYVIQRYLDRISDETKKKLRSLPKGMLQVFYWVSILVVWSPWLASWYLTADYEPPASVYEQKIERYEGWRVDPVPVE